MGSIGLMSQMRKWFQIVPRVGMLSGFIHPNQGKIGCFISSLAEFPWAVGGTHMGSTHGSDSNMGPIFAPGGHTSTANRRKSAFVA